MVIRVSVECIGRQWTWAKDEICHFSRKSDVSGAIVRSKWSFLIRQRSSIRRGWSKNQRSWCKRKVALALSELSKPILHGSGRNLDGRRRGGGFDFRRARNVPGSAAGGIQRLDGLKQGSTGPLKILANDIAGHIQGCVRRVLSPRRRTPGEVVRVFSTNH